MQNIDSWYMRSKIAQASLPAALLSAGLAMSSPGAGGFTPSQNFKQTLARHEGYQPLPYYDSRGILTVGIGFNMERPNAAKLMAAQGINMADVAAKRRKVSRDEAWALAEADLATAVADAKSLFPNFDSVPPGVQEVLVNMSFNLGKGKLAEFKKLRAAVARGDWATASAEMLDSKWAKQVGAGDHKDGSPQRAKELAQQMRRGGAVAAGSPAPVASAGGRATNPSPSPSSGGAGKVVTVMPGETLSLLAKRHLGSAERWGEIAKLNGIADPKSIKPGQKLRLP